MTQIGELWPEAAAFVAHAHRVLDAIDEHGRDPVLDGLRHDAGVADLLQRWIATTTWNDSRRMLQQRPSVLLGPDVEQSLTEDGSDTARLHLAIVEFCRRDELDIDTVYDAITDPEDASDLIRTACSNADANLLLLVLQAWQSLGHEPANRDRLMLLAAAARHDQNSFDDALPEELTALVQHYAERTPTDVRQRVLNRISEFTAATNAPSLAVGRTRNLLQPSN